MLALVIAAFVSLRRGREIQSGLLLGLGFFKFQYLIPIFLLLFLWRKWRIVLGLVLTSSATVGLSLWIVGLSAIRGLARTLLNMSTGLSSVAERMKYGTLPERMPNLRGLAYAIGQHFSVTQDEVAVVVAICSVSVIVMTLRMKPSLPLALSVAILLSYHCLIHDSSLLILPVGMVLEWSLPNEKVGASLIALTVFILPAVIFQFFGSRFFLMTIPILGLVWAEQSRSRYSETLPAHPE